MAVEHRVEVYNTSDQLIAILDKARGLKYSQTLNRGSNFSFSLDISDPKCTESILAGGQNYIKYYRGTQLRWAGEIEHRLERLASDNESVDVLCVDWFTLLKNKYITTEEIYTATNEGEILQALITYAQVQTNGDLGITFGVNSSTSSRDRTYSDKNIQEAFVDMSGIIEGVDFEITPARVLNIYDKKSTDRSGSHVFEYGININNIERVKDWTALKNDLKGYGADTLIRTADSPSSHGTYGRRQSIESFTDDILTATLDRHLEDVLRINAGPMVTYKLTLLPDAQPAYGTYEIGDLITLSIDRGIVSINQAVRIYGWNVTITDEGQEDIELVVSAVQ